jgi:hypothetical protein
LETPGLQLSLRLGDHLHHLVGFSALLLGFRQTIVGKMTNYDSYFTLSFIQAGFIVTAGGLSPQLLAFFEMVPNSVWRESSVIMAIPIFLFVAHQWADLSTRVGADSEEAFFHRPSLLRRQHQHDRARSRAPARGPARPFD